MKSLALIALLVLGLHLGQAHAVTCAGPVDAGPFQITTVYPDPVWVPRGGDIPNGIAVYIDSPNLPLKCMPFGIATLVAPQSGPSVVFPEGFSSSLAVKYSASSPDSTHVLETTTARANNIPGVAVVNVRIYDNRGSADGPARTVIIAGDPVASASIPAEVSFGMPVQAAMDVSLPWLDCAYASTAPGAIAASLTITVDGVDMAVNPFSVPSSCDGSTYHLSASGAAPGLLPGTHEVTLTASMGMLGTSQATQTVVVASNSHAVLPSSTVAFDVAIGGCSVAALGAGRVGDSGYPLAAPSATELPSGVVRVDASACASGSTQQVVLTSSGPIPDGAQLWAFGVEPSNATPHWYPLHAAFSGSSAMFELAAANDGTLHATVALVLPRSGATPGSLQDLWWGGASQNGWGLMVTQHGATLFSELFIYDAQGQPRWLVMPGGAWNSEGTAYTGNLYRPHGSPYYAYDANAFVVGNSVGTLKISVNGTDSLTLDYTIDGVVGSKSLHRQRFGPPATTFATGHDDLWWGGAQQDGWGLALAQQGDTLFGVLYSYDASGNPVWFVAPDIRDLSSFDVYQTDGSPWLGTTYEPAGLRVGKVGSGSLALGPDSGWMSLSIEGHSISGGIFRQPF